MCSGCWTQSTTLRLINNLETNMVTTSMIHDSPEVVYFWRIRDGCGIKSEESEQEQLSVCCRCEILMRMFSEVKLEQSPEGCSISKVMADEYLLHEGNFQAQER